MLILRLLAILSVLVIGGGLIAYFMTGKRQYLTLVIWVLKSSVLAGLLLFVLMGLERMLVMPL